jgi:MerR HTH family regulatory protein
MLTLEEMAHALHVSTRTVQIWHAHGLVCGHAYTDKGQRLYELLAAHAPKKAQGVKLSRRCSAHEHVPHGRKEVQCEA